MLEHLGAFGIDADALSHQAIAPGGPAYGPVVEMFGKWLVGPGGAIDRARLARVVFSDPVALEKLESIIHPLVGQAIDFLVKRTKSGVVVIEAIKLLEAGLARDCDAVWAVHVPEPVQEQRLVEKRKLSRVEARQRITAQGSQAEKLRAARVKIDNSGSFEDTWLQVQAAFNRIQRAPAPFAQASTQPMRPATPQTLHVRRGMPSDATAIAALIREATHGKVALARAEVMAAFGDKAYFLAEAAGKLVGLAGWKVENLVVRVDEVYTVPGVAFDKVAPSLLEAVETASRELQSEAALVFVPSPLALTASQALAGRGFAPQAPERLGVAAWVEAARESMPAGSAMLFKRLREDRVLRPI
jgi:dephospho-CoA kinase